jgi:hypothetical protein
MFYRFFLLLILAFQCSSAWPQSAYDQLSAKSISRLDLAIVRLRQELHEFQVETNFKEYSAYRVMFTSAQFVEKKEKIIIRASVVAEPTEFNCKIAIQTLMNNFRYSEQSEFSAKLFYSKYFMPESAPGHSYEVNLYKPVYESVSFMLTVLDKKYEPRLKCSYSGSEAEISYSEV